MFVCLLIFTGICVVVMLFVRVCIGSVSMITLCLGIFKWMSYNSHNEAWHAIQSKCIFVIRIVWFNRRVSRHIQSTFSMFKMNRDNNNKKKIEKKMALRAIVVGGRSTPYLVWIAALFVEFLHDSRKWCVLDDFTPLRPLTLTHIRAHALTVVLLIWNWMHNTRTRNAIKIDDGTIKKKYSVVERKRAWKWLTSIPCEEERKESILLKGNSLISIPSYC